MENLERPNPVVSKQCQGRCPKCGSLEFEYRSEEYNDGWYTIYLKCSECGINFAEEHKYSHSWYVEE